MPVNRPTYSLRVFDQPRWPSLRVGFVFESSNEHKHKRPQVETQRRNVLFSDRLASSFRASRAAVEHHAAWLCLVVCGRTSGRMKQRRGLLRRRLSRACVVGIGAVLLELRGELSG